LKQAVTFSSREANRSMTFFGNGLAIFFLVFAAITVIRDQNPPITIVGILLAGASAFLTYRFARRSVVVDDVGFHVTLLFEDFTLLANEIDLFSVIEDKVVAHLGDGEDIVLYGIGSPDDATEPQSQKQISDRLNQILEVEKAS
jgi:hypothetical protein